MQTIFLSGVALFALLAIADPAVAQSARDTTAATADPAETAEAPASDIIVTGSARQQRRFDVS